MVTRRESHFCDARLERHCATVDVDRSTIEYLQPSIFNWQNFPCVIWGNVEGPIDVTQGYLYFGSKRVLHIHLLRQTKHSPRIWNSLGVRCWMDIRCRTAGLQKLKNNNVIAAIKSKPLKIVISSDHHIIISSDRRIISSYRHIISSDQQIIFFSQPQADIGRHVRKRGTPKP